MFFEKEKTDILQNPEFQNSSLGIHVSKNGVSFCLHPAYQDVSFSYVQTFKGAFPKDEIIKMVKELDEMLKKHEVHVLATTFSFPGPINKNTVEIPNWWATGESKFSVDDFKGLELSKNNVNFINEIQALGHGLISTDEFYGLEDDFISLWKPPAMDVMPTLYPLYFSSETATVIQVAFGLGSAFIAPIDSPDSYRVIASEWGHSIVHLCGPDEQGYNDELDLIDFISQNKEGRAVEWEDICSIRGLKNCYEYEMKKNHLDIDPKLDILKEIEKDPTEPISSKALSTHFKFLMRFARMCAISFTCKCVFITYSVFQGGTQTLQNHIAMCRDEFMHFTKNEWVSNVSVFVQTSDKNISSIGVMYHAFLGLFRSNKEGNFLTEWL